MFAAKKHIFALECGLLPNFGCQVEYEKLKYRRNSGATRKEVKFGGHRKAKM